jgi:hypothetical protein
MQLKSDKYTEATSGFSIVFETSEEYKSSFLDYAIFTTDNDDDISKNCEINSPTIKARRSSTKNGFSLSEPTTFSGYDRASIKQHIRATLISDRPSNILPKTHKERSFNPFSGLKRL